MKRPRPRDRHVTMRIAPCTRRRAPIVRTSPARADADRIAFAPPNAMNRLGESTLVDACRPAGWTLGGVAFGAVNIAVDQRMGELLLPAHQLEAVRLEFAAARVTLVQRLSLCDEHADRFLYAFDASHRRSSSRLGLGGGRSRVWPRRRMGGGRRPWRFPVRPRCESPRLLSRR